MPHYPKEIEYSDKYQDDYYDYRHVFLPKELFKKMTPYTLLDESEWRALGVQQSVGWVHYAFYKPEPHILLFRRPRGVNPKTGKNMDVHAKERLQAYERVKHKNWED